MKAISERCTVFTSSLFQTNSTVIDLDDQILLVDPTWLPSEIESIKIFLETQHPGKELWLFITHYDYDHVWGAPAFKDAHVIAPSLKDMEHLGKKCIDQWRQWDVEHYIKRPYPVELPKVKYELSEKTILNIGQWKLYFYPCPGHTADSYCCIIEEEDLLIAGDYLCDVEIPWVGHSLHEYENTLEQFNEILLNHEVGACIPGHGIACIDRLSIKERIDTGLNYLQLLSMDTVETDIKIKDLISAYPYPRASEEIHELNKKFIGT